MRPDLHLQKVQMPLCQDSPSRGELPRYSTLEAVGDRVGQIKRRAR